MKTKGISSSAYYIIDDCLTAEINRLQEAVRECKDIAEAIVKSELLGKLRAARSEFISVHTG